MSGAELDRLAAVCLLPSFPAHEPPDWLLRWLDRGVTGVLLFSNNVRDRGQLAALTARLRAVRGELLVAIDEEGGDVTRLEVQEGCSFPGNAALGAVDDVELTERVAAAIAAELVAAGVNLDLAPVADVNVNPANSVIGVRSFGADAGLVARHVAAFVAGLQRSGVAACAKHFPGHGATERDSHLELPTVTGDYTEALVPFRAAIEAGVQSIMTAHVRLAALDDAPATLSRAAIEGLLRGELGYDGLVVTDACEMRGFSDVFGIEEGAVRALTAGADALILGRRLGEEWVERVQRALVDAVAAGRLPEARLREAAGRVLRTARWAASGGDAGAPDRAAGAVAARRALVAEGRVGVEQPVLVVELQPEANIAAGEAEHSLGQMLAERLPGTTVVEEAPDRNGRQVVAVVRDAHRHPWMRNVVEALDDPIVVEIGLPVWRPAAARGYVATYGGSRASFEAVCDLLVAEGE
jgi:beta-N-acetylhexosaminidase